jgi:WD40 repeat protein
MDEDFQVDAAPAPSLTPSPSFKTYSNPRKTTKTGEAYILQIACTSSHYAAAASAPSNAIYLFDRGSLDRVKTLAGHQNGLSALSVSPAGNHALFSCGKDGSVKMWDERTGVATVESEYILLLPKRCCQSTDNKVALVLLISSACLWPTSWLS